MKQKPSDYKSHQMPEPIVLGHVTIIVPNLSLAVTKAFLELETIFHALLSLKKLKTCAFELK